MQKSLQDGGAPIEKYIIEKKGPIGDWEAAEEVLADKTTATVGNLKQGNSYQFRVKAVNKAGPSAASNPSRSVVAKPRHCALSSSILSRLHLLLQWRLRLIGRCFKKFALKPDKRSILT
jgi:hypothetical protein